ncbi:hydrogenase expression/formation protein [bacterium (candidate division B38) B3_B38]|nr:MAG: hydrogenase expression/formation protein [bacterium (candidate division B38) B3_B38]
MGIHLFLWEYAVDKFEVGKLPIRYLESLLSRIAIKDKRVVVGPGIGKDAAVIDFSDRYLVAKTDPITLTSSKIGWWGVHINANDVACLGATPRWFLATILLPEGKTNQSLAEEIFSEILLACKELGVTLCGGHTEITQKLKQPIVVGNMLGEVAKENLVDGTKARAGDEVILVKGIAIEGTSIIAREKGEELRGRFSEEFINRCRQFLVEPGISVVKEALLANSLVRVKGMHDPTEGGLWTGLYELAVASGKGMYIEADAIPVYSETEQLCQAFGLDPLGLIASGALLVVAARRDTAKLIGGLEREGVKAVRIGRLTPEKEGMRIRRNGKLEEITPLSQDEIARILD